MTPEQQRIAIAEACGKVNIHKEVHPTITYLWCGYAPEREIVPNYPFDLNAMHEVEKVLEGHQEYDYATRITGGPGRPDSFFKILHATAAQRAEAFLRTLNLWTD